jgi:CRISPR system Cascade subunit CasC
MSRFTQLHLLTFYGPSNLNRDDVGRPKTARVGGVERLRISSQALKRAVRTSEAFQRTLEGHLGERTQRLGDEILETLVEEGVAPDVALKAARGVAGIFGKIKGEKDDHPVRIEQLAFVGPEERASALALARRLAAGEGIDPEKEKASVLRKRDAAADIAMFGRMLADDPDFNRGAAVQVAHAFTTHKTPVEEDYYTAVDDLKDRAEDAGAGFIGNAGFGSGVFYLYVCIDRALLVENLGGDAGLANDALAALTTALATVSPGGKQASFASRARASYILAENGDQQPRSLAGAFAKPVGGDDPIGGSIAALTVFRDQLDKAYGPGADAAAEMNVSGGSGTLADIIAFIRQPSA